MQHLSGLTGTEPEFVTFVPPAPTQNLFNLASVDDVINAGVEDLFVTG